MHAGAVFNIPGASKQPKCTVFHDFIYINLKFFLPIFGEKADRARAPPSSPPPPRVFVRVGLGREWGVEFTYSEVSCLGTYLSEVTCAKYKHIAKYIEIYRNYMKSKESI